MYFAPWCAYINRNIDLFPFIYFSYTQQQIIDMVRYD